MNKIEGFQNYLLKYPQINRLIAKQKGVTCKMFGIFGKFLKLDKNEKGRTFRYIIGEEI